MKTLLIGLLITGNVFAGECSLQASGAICEMVSVGSHTETIRSQWDPRISVDVQVEDYECRYHYELYLAVDGSQYLTSTTASGIFKELDTLEEQGVCESYKPQKCSISGASGETYVAVAGVQGIKVPVTADTFNEARKIIALLGIKNLCL